MSLELDHIAARDLARELLERIPTIVRGQLTRSMRRRARRIPVPQPRAGEDRGSFATFTRPDAPPLSLLGGYRRRIKPRWAQGYWPVASLLQLDASVPLPPSAHELADTLRTARTLPLPLREIADVVVPIAADHPSLVVSAGRVDARLGVSELEVVPTREQVRQRVDYQIANARRVLRNCAGRSIAVPQLRMLEQGCGDGETTIALAAVGVGQSVGVDMKLEGVSPSRYTTMIRDEFVRADRRAASARIEAGDAMHLPFPDGSFDVVHSMSVVEHLADPRAALREAYRVLAPRGVAYFDVNPWFGPDGGHGLCTLDCPWGHVRLSAEQFETYVRTYRPYEAAYAIDYYHHGFQRPRMTMAELESAIVESGFHISEWHEHREGFRDHGDLLTPELLADCRRQNPTVAVRDLMCRYYSMLLVKP